MFSVSADYYDAIYAVFKDYGRETAKIASLLRRVRGECRTILDVACGTGEHARRLADAGFDVDGLDVEEALLRIARRKCPSGRFFHADMTAFALPHRYDAVLCLFSSIGYARTLDRVGRAFCCFREHLQPGGVAIVEPWFEPGVLDERRVSTTTGEANGVRVTRTSRVELADTLSRLHFEYEIVDAEGVRRAEETHELGLFTRDELLETFRAAGLEAEYDPVGLMNRGLYVARVPA